MRFGTRAAAIAAVTVVLGAAALTPAAAENEFGVRDWLSWGSSTANLYDTSGSVLVSRLSFRDMTTNAVELYGVVRTPMMFYKGIAGMGFSNNGSLQDEDFFPSYQSTESVLRNGRINYLTLDAGRYFMTMPTSRVGAFIGYNFFQQNMNAFGCVPDSVSPAACGGGSIPNSVAVISETNNFHSLRVGVTGDMTSGRWKISGDAALLATLLSGADSHWLRICGFTDCFTGPIPADGLGWGFQLEAMANYQVTPGMTVGIGARWWQMNTSGKAHFENHVVNEPGASAQRLDWSTNLFGITAQVAWHF